MPTIWPGLMGWLLEFSFLQRLISGAIIAGVIAGVIGGPLLAYVPQWWKAGNPEKKTSDARPSGMTMFGIKGDVEDFEFKNNVLKGEGKLLDIGGNAKGVQIEGNKQTKPK
ncbi:hypothetical protein SAMN05443247_07628 [Bradyrhizobium erythrophlei]|nr:hypothetical protein SAMN05443247_07628 [Bradyrhizobium erythrophlei]